MSYKFVTQIYEWIYSCPVCTKEKKKANCLANMFIFSWQVESFRPVGRDARRERACKYDTAVSEMTVFLVCLFGGLWGGSWGCKHTRHVNTCAGGDCRSDGTSSVLFSFKPLLFPLSLKQEPEDKLEKLAPQWESFYQRMSLLDTVEMPNLARIHSATTLI